MRRATVAAGTPPDQPDGFGSGGLPALGAHTLTPHEALKLVQRPSNVLGHLINIALGYPRLEEQISKAVEQARELLDERPRRARRRVWPFRGQQSSVGYSAALGRARRLARETWSLLELLIASRYIKDPDGYGDR
ncbi:hypothetical protein [Streptomyces sp. MNP-20]|uniref:hypothetical protein n=1 Tax=Streptomyces sp. MNP-20 TaxID=2721165 RepID=UPI001553D492|nr:hypothetical protein [Streptomyces sp. MNP-20]